MGFDFTLIAPLLPSHCGFSSVLGRGVSSLVKSGVFLSMIVQQPVVILVLSQEGVRARPSTPPSWLIRRFCFVTGQEGRIFSLGRGQVGNRRGQNDVSVSVLGQDNWVGFDILWLGKLGPKYDQIFVF